MTMALRTFLTVFVSGLVIVFVDFVVRNHGGCACGEFAL